MKTEAFKFHYQQCKAALATSYAWGPANFVRGPRAYWQHIAAYHRQECARILRTRSE